MWRKFFFAFFVCLGSLFINHVMSSGSQEPVPTEDALILAVETAGRCYLANNRFETDQMNSLFDKFLFACLAESESEIELNEISKTKKALFIRKPNERVKTDGDTTDFIDPKCNEKVMPSFIEIGTDPNNPEATLYLVGYEIFLGDEPTCHKIDPYDSAGLDKTQKFAWFNVYTVAFDKKSRNVISVFSYSMVYKNYKIMPPQEINISDYFSGVNEFLDRCRQGYTYSQGQQEHVFQELLFKEKPLPISYVNMTQKRYLMGIHFAPLNSFGTSVLRRTGQNYGNVAMMWNMVYNNTWWKVETHVELLTQGVNGIHVITGAYGTLQLFGVDIYFNPFPKWLKVPAAFFKIVSYSPNEIDKYNMVIVTSNNPYEENDRVNNRICKQNQCHLFGWEYVEQNFFARGRTTCCELTKEVLTELKMNRYESLVDKTLDLNKVPHWGNGQLTLDVKQYIVNQMDGKAMDKPADDNMYRSNINLAVPEEDDEEKLSRFVSILYANYVQPYFSSINVGIESNVESSTKLVE